MPNKIGTYGLAVWPGPWDPFYVAAPTSTIDLTLAGGRRLPIEERPAEEVTHSLGQKVAPGVWRCGIPRSMLPSSPNYWHYYRSWSVREPYHKSIKELFAHDALNMPQGEFVITNAQIITCDEEERVFSQGDIHVKDGKIVGVGPQLPVPPGGERSSMPQDTSPSRVLSTPIPMRP